MNVRQRVQAFWAGERPDVIPYTIYQNEWRHTRNDPAWNGLFERGLGLTWPVPLYRAVTSGAEFFEDTVWSNGKELRRQAWRTPLGEISALWQGEWQVKYWLESARDYRALQYVVEHTELIPDYQRYHVALRDLPGYCIVVPEVGATPLLKVMLDYASLEQYSYHLADFPGEVQSLLDAYHRQFKRIVEITAEGPGDFIWVPESFSVDMTGPKRFQQQVLSVYEECFPMLRSKGKKVGVHFDGKTASVIDMVRTAPVDVIESLTPPPEGDQTLAEARANWSELCFWVNINCSDYILPPEKLRQRVLDLAEQGSPDGTRLAFEISEEYPQNWKDSIPIILDALNEHSLRSVL